MKSLNYKLKNQNVVVETIRRKDQNRSSIATEMITAYFFEKSDFWHSTSAPFLPLVVAASFVEVSLLIDV